MTDTPKTATEALEGVAPQPRYIEHIQFEGRDCVVLSPEEYEALWERALSAQSAQHDKAMELLRRIKDDLETRADDGALASGSQDGAIDGSSKK